MAVAIAPVIASAFVSIGIGAATAGILAQVVVIAVGLGITMLAQALFSSKPTQPKPSDGQTILRQSTAPRTRAYGRVKVGGTLMFANTQRGAYGRVIAMGSGEIDAVEEHWIDDHLCTLSGTTVTSPPFVPHGEHHAFIDFRLGTDSPAPYSDLIAAYPSLWTTAHLGKGIPSAFLVLHQAKSEDMGDIFPQYGSTGYRQVQRGAKVPNLFGGVLTTPEWSDNAARIILDYLTHPDGLRLDPSWITNADADWGTAIATCDEPIALAEGGYESRYRIWNTYRFDERPADVLARFLAACDGTIFPTPGGGLAIKVGKWTTPTVTIDDDAILGFSEFGRGRDVLTTANTIRARYTSPDHDYLETDADPWVDEADVAERGEFAVDFDLFAVPSHTQTRRLMKIAAARANPDWVGVLQCNLRALPVMGERYINVIISELGINETFEVLNVQLTIEQGTILNGVRVQIASLSAAAYDWTALARTGEEGTPPSVPPLIVPENTIPVPTGISVVAEGAMVAVSWAPPPATYLQGEVRYKQTALTYWLSAPVAADALVTHVGPLEFGTEYEFQVRYRSDSSTRVSDWSPSHLVMIAGAPTVPGTYNPVKVATPASSDILTMSEDDRALYVDGGPLAALTILLPDIGSAFMPVTTDTGADVTTGDGNAVYVLTSPGETTEDMVEICFANPVAALDIQDALGVTVPGSPTSAYGPGAAIMMRWVDETSSWIYWK